MRAKPSRLAAAAVDLMKLEDRRRLETEKGLPRIPPEKILASSREELGLDPLLPIMEKWAKPPPRKGGRAR